MATPQGGAAPTSSGTTRVLFVCLGNICRSPTAEGVMRALVAQAGMGESVELDSAGTGAWHVGSSPDARAVAVARERGVALEGSARQVAREDFFYFDFVIAMDRSNLRELRQLAPGEDERAKVRLLREFDPASAGRAASAGIDVGAGAGADALDVPDPYYGASGGFDEVFDLVRAACAGLLAQIQAGEAR